MFCLRQVTYIVSIIILVHLYWINESCLLSLRHLSPKDLPKWLPNTQRNTTLITFTQKPRFPPSVGWGIGRIIISGSWTGASAYRRVINVGMLYL